MNWNLFVLPKRKVVDCTKVHFCGIKRTTNTTSEHPLANWNHIQTSTSPEFYRPSASTCFDTKYLCIRFTFLLPYSLDQKKLEFWQHSGGSNPSDGGGCPVIQILRQGRGRFPKKFFLRLPQFGLKTRGRAPRAPPLDPPLQQYKKHKDIPAFRLKQNQLRVFVHAGRKFFICKKTTSGLKNPCKLWQMFHHNSL